MDHGPGGHDGALADRDALGHHCAAGDPDTVRDVDRAQPPGEVWCAEVMVSRDQQNMAGDHHVESDPYASSGIDLARPTDVALAGNLQILRSEELRPSEEIGVIAGVHPESTQCTKTETVVRNVGERTVHDKFCCLATRGKAQGSGGGLL